MTPHKAGNRGTFIIDRRTRVGRISIASGTTHLPTFRRINEMITSLGETGRSDLLREIRDGRLTPLEVYEAFRVNELHRLPMGEMLSPLYVEGDKEAFDARVEDRKRPAPTGALWKWLDSVECSTAQKAAHKTMCKRFGKKGATVSELPKLLAESRETYRAAKHPASFNRVRASVLAFLRDTLKRSHPLYIECRDVPVMKEKKAPRRQPQTFAQLVGHAEKLTDQRDRNALWAMALTGMGGKEYYIDGWAVESDRVRIFGIKREKRSRIVPRVLSRYYMVAAPSRTVGKVWEKRRFGERLLELCGIHTYDLRRTYANILEAAGIPRTRRKLYMGHAGGDVTSLYEHHEVDQFIAEDTRKIETHLIATQMKARLEVVK